MNYIFNLKQKQNERKIKNGKNEFTVCTKNLIRKPSHMKEVATFQIWKEKSLCPKKKFCNQNQYLKKNKNLVLRVWFALLNYKKTQQSRISIAHFFSPVFVFCQKPKKFPFQMSKY
jgi:hypothetical protein